MGFTITRNSTSVVIDVLEDYEPLITRKTKTFEVFSDYHIHDLGKEDEAVTIIGVVYNDAQTKIDNLRSFARNGNVITISGFPESVFNTDWVIKDFKYKRICPSPVVYRITLKLSLFQ